MRTVILVLIGAFAVGVSISLSAMQTAPRTAPTATSKPMMAGQSSQMAATRDKKLEDLVQQLNAAKGNDRIDRLVAVVNELVADQLRMSEMMAMHGRMMQPAAAPDAEHSSHHPGRSEDVQK
jgi:hypothetical protein